jgi:hypothetical protein
MDRVPSCGMLAKSTATGASMKTLFDAIGMEIMHPR